MSKFIVFFAPCVEHTRMYSSKSKQKFKMQYLPFFIFKLIKQSKLNRNANILCIMKTFQISSPPWKNTSKFKYVKLNCLNLTCFLRPNISVFSVLDSLPL